MSKQNKKVTYIVLLLVSVKKSDDIFNGYQIGKTSIYQPKCSSKLMSDRGETAISMGMIMMMMIVRISKMPKTKQKSETYSFVAQIREQVQRHSPLALDQAQLMYISRNAPQN